MPSWINQQELSKKLFPDKQKHCPRANLSLQKNWRYIVLMNSPPAVKIIWGNRFRFMNTLNLFDLKKKKKVESLICIKIFFSIIPTRCMHSARVALCMSMGIILGRQGIFRTDFFFFCILLRCWYKTSLKFKKREKNYLVLLETGAFKSVLFHFSCKENFFLPIDLSTVVSRI